jgi:hypothetical protein
MNVLITVLYQKPGGNPSYETCWMDVQNSEKLDEPTAKNLVTSMENRLGVKVAVLCLVKLED